MALTTTTLGSAAGRTDTSITVASATGFAAGSFILVDQEFMQVTKGYVSGSTSVPVIRGLDGTVQAAHASGANVSVGVGSDFSVPVGQTSTQNPIVRGRTLTSYTAAGAITLPTPGSDAVAVLNGTGALAMTLANPTKDMDGSILYIVANGKAAHTVTYTAGFGDGGSGYDVMTFASGARNSVQAMAINGIWVLIPSLIAGTATAVSVTIA